MGYSHCDRHDLEATNGCESCLAKEVLQRLQKLTAHIAAATTFTADMEEVARQVAISLLNDPLPESADDPTLVFRWLKEPGLAALRQAAKPVERPAPPVASIWRCTGAGCITPAARRCYCDWCTATRARNNDGQDGFNACAHHLASANILHEMTTLGLPGRPAEWKPV